MGLIGGILQPLYARRPVHADVAARLPAAPAALAAGDHATTARTTSGGPNFAYDLCVRKIPPEERAELDLSALAASPSTAPSRSGRTRSTASPTAFAPCGFRREAFYPCYGLAEATLIVTGGRADGEPVVRHGRRRRSAGRAVPPGAHGGRTRWLAGCGRPGEDHGAAHRRPGDAARAVPPGTVGEIWVRGPSVAHGLLAAAPRRVPGTHRRPATGALPAHRRPRLPRRAASCSSPAGSRT